MQSHPAKIVRADETDAGEIITILSTGFQNDPVADGYSQMTMPGKGCIRSFSAPLFKWH